MKKKTKKNKHHQTQTPLSPTMRFKAALNRFFYSRPRKNTHTLLSHACEKKKFVYVGIMLSWKGLGGGFWENNIVIIEAATVFGFF